MHWRRLIRYVVLAVSPLFIALAGNLIYNQIRFGNPLDVGLAYHNVSDFFRSDFQTYGVFNTHYIPNNLYYQFVFYPFPIRQESGMGGSLFLLSPVFFGAIIAFWRPRNKVYVLALLASIVLTYIPIVLCMGTGYWQFGPRYTLDFTVPLLVLTAMGIQKWKTPFLVALTVLSFIQYFVGVISVI